MLNGDQGDVVFFFIFDVFKIHGQLLKYKNHKGHEACLLRAFAVK
jgi:hypothetical protein